ncbi:hypothetical protein PEBR_27688 [Penicillium brasilianum]|uniref:Uncharacterized protein n=1 Tax=Penicillium brasilianum TaxID=104259 RepID=A0A1S9RV22_PENBI|nr:hypothetical protein PEBR_27688 [Penicillium brasilianum]
MAWPIDHPSAWDGNRRLERTFGYYPDSSSLRPTPGLVTPVQAPNAGWSVSFATGRQPVFSTVDEAVPSLSAYAQPGEGGVANVPDPWAVHIQGKDLSGAMPSSSVPPCVVHRPVSSPPDTQTDVLRRPRVSHNPGFPITNHEGSRHQAYAEADEPPRNLQYTPAIDDHHVVRYYASTTPV